MERQAQFPHTTALSCVDDEFVQALYTEQDRYRYVKKDGVYVLISNGTFTRIKMIEEKEGKVTFLCQCGYPQNHMLPCRHCIILLILLDKKYMNKAEVYKLVNDVLKIDTYKMFMEESQIILQNMSYVKSKNVSTGILDVQKTGNEQLVYTPLDEQTYSDWFCYENVTVCAEQVAFNKIVSPDVHSACLRIVRTDAMKVDKHHEHVEVINKENEGMSGNVQPKEEAKNNEKKKDEKEVEEKKPLKPKCESVQKISCVEHWANRV